MTSVSDAWRVAVAMPDPCGRPGGVMSMMAIFVAEGDEGGVVIDDIAIADDAAIQVARQVLQGGQSTADVFAMRAPVFGRCTTA